MPASLATPSAMSPGVSLMPNLIMSGSVSNPSRTADRGTQNRMKRRDFSIRWASARPLETMVAMTRAHTLCQAIPIPTASTT